jgi:hypothetical protein
MNCGCAWTLLSPAPHDCKCRWSVSSTFSGTLSAHLVQNVKTQLRGHIRRSMRFISETTGRISIKFGIGGQR